MRCMRLIFAAFLLTVSAFCMQAQQKVSFEQLRKMIDDGLTSVQEELLIEGLIITDTDDVNIEQSRQYMYNKTTTEPNSRTMYIQSYDGRYGFRLCFNHNRSGRLPRYSHAELDLKGATLEKHNGGYTISGLEAESKVSVSTGVPEDRVVKERTLETLSAEDLYTYVTLKNMEFVFKDGSYSNTNEAYGKDAGFNKKCWPSGAMDGWATLVCDSEGRPFYLMINSRTPWRRDGRGVQQGSGDISGVLVSCQQIRYGDCIGTFQLRPLEHKDIAIDWKAPSAFRTAVEWNWSDGKTEFFTEDGPQMKIGADKVLADKGKGFVYTDVKGEVVRGHEPNNVKVEFKGDPDFKGERGYVNHGAYTIKARSCEWWDWEKDTPKSVYVNFSTAKLKGRNLLFAFSFAGGFGGANSSYGFPVYWKVEYSVDGENFVKAGDEEYEMHSLPWYWDNDVQGVQYQTCWRAGMGFKEHVLRLPEDAFGKKEVIVRISPSRKNIATLAEDEYDKMALRPANKSMCTVNFGAFIIRYN